MTWGIAWDIWPRDTALPRIMIGHSADLDGAQHAVELALAAHEDDAIAGTVSIPFSRVLICRRGRADGQFVWAELAHPGLAWPAAAS